MSHTIEEWEKKLVGKVFVGPGEEAPKDKKPDQIFKEEDLAAAEDHRVLGPMSPMSRDFRPERLTVQVDENMVCTGVRFV